MTASISVRTELLGVADYNSVRVRQIRDLEKKSKCGVSDYWIEAYFWGGKKIYVGIIDACWLTNTVREFKTLREASNWIRSMIYDR